MILFIRLLTKLRWVPLKRVILLKIAHWCDRLRGCQNLHIVIVSSDFLLSESFTAAWLYSMLLLFECRHRSRRQRILAEVRNDSGLLAYLWDNDHIVVNEGLLIGTAERPSWPLMRGVVVVGHHEGVWRRYGITEANMMGWMSIRRSMDLLLFNVILICFPSKIMIRQRCRVLFLSFF
jgi:hypothetical protein